MDKHVETGDKIRADSVGQKCYWMQPSQKTKEKIKSLGEERKAAGERGLAEACEGFAAVQQEG